MNGRLRLPLALGFFAISAGFAGAIPGCVPSGSAPSYDAGPTGSAVAAFRPSLNIMTAPFEDNFDRPDAGEGAWLPLEAGAPSSANAPARPRDAGNDAGGADAGAEAGPFGVDAGAEHRIPSNLGPDWIPAKTHAWRVENGRLCGQNAYNHGVWLNRTLPVNARIEFDAIASNDEGDLKAEVWGDGQSYATGTSYTNATSYLPILGGWKNTLHVLARLNEHGTDRHEIKVDRDSDDPRQRPVVKGQSYRFKIERNDGKTVRFSVDGVEYHAWTDPTPLAGQGHDHFGFNAWEAKVCFDNVKVTPL